MPNKFNFGQCKLRWSLTKERSHEVYLPERLSLEPVLDVSDNDSSLLLKSDVLSDSDELLMCSPNLYCIKLSFLVRSGGSAKDGNGSVIEMVRFGGEGAASGLCGDMTLAERLRDPGLFGDFPGDGIISSSTGG